MPKKKKVDGKLQQLSKDIENLNKKLRTYAYASTADKQADLRLHQMYDKRAKHRQANQPKPP